MFNQVSKFLLTILSGAVLIYYVVEAGQNGSEQDGQAAAAQASVAAATSGQNLPQSSEVSQQATPQNPAGSMPAGSFASALPTQTPMIPAPAQQAVGVAQGMPMPPQALQPQIGQQPGQQLPQQPMAAQQPPQAIMGQGGAPLQWPQAPQPMPQMAPQYPPMPMQQPGMMPPYSPQGGAYPPMPYPPMAYPPMPSNCCPCVDAAKPHKKHHHSH